uniref:Uncharacterized protein n=1 Tax=Lepeophtheirus salmonis TaxID=72036 RepID=A0A0K2T3M6_LEPSM
MIMGTFCLEFHTEFDLM